MDSACISYAKLPKSSALVLDYLYHFDRVADFYRSAPFDSAGFRRIADSLGEAPYPRAELQQILTRQNRALGCGDTTLENIQRLASPDTFAVVTGQQVGLLSGPALTIYKALTAVKLAQSLSERGLACVPIFWLATEDHDFEEVARAVALDDEYNSIELRDPGSRPATQASVGYVKLSSEISGAIDSFERTLPVGESRDRLLHDLRAAYRPGAGWGEAFGRFLTALVAKWGVIFIDPLDADVHRLCAPFYQRAIDEAAELRASLLERSRQLTGSGYHAQVHVGDDSTLLFASENGNRETLRQPAVDAFELNGRTRMTASDVTEWATRSPLDFTPSALFRPVVQDRLLPTVAYVGGPAEIAYQAQTAVVYPAFERPQPVIFPRAGFTLIDSRTERLFEKYSLGIEDGWSGEERLGRKIVASNLGEGWSERLDQSERDLGEILGRVQRDVEAIDPTLLDFVRHTDGKMRYQWERLRGKITRAALERSSLLQRHTQALLRFLTPLGDLQERQVSGVYFLARAGYGLLDRLLEAIDLTCAGHRLVKY